MMKFGSLFAGIGGIDLGLERAGMECAWQVEINEWCQKILKKHWPDVERFGDVRECGKHNLEPVDLIAGGFPCQPHSVAGKRRGAEDDRNLWPEFIRIVRETKPRYVLAENVSGIVSTYLDTVLSDLESEGYATRTFNLPACAFDAPHRRERIFVVAYGKDKGIVRREWVKRNDKDKNNEGGIIRRRSGTDNGRENVQISNSKGLERTTWEGIQIEERNRIAPWSSNVSTQTNWTTEPDVGRVAHGVPNRVDRLRGLGNAVVPQVAEWIGRRIIEHNNLFVPK